MLGDDDPKLRELKQAAERADQRAGWVSGSLFVVVGVPALVGAFLLFPVLGLTAIALGIFGVAWLGVCVGIAWMMIRTAEKRVEDYQRYKASQG